MESRVFPSASVVMHTFRFPNFPVTLDLKGIGKL